MIDIYGKIRYTVFRLEKTNLDVEKGLWLKKEFAMNLREAKVGQEYIISRIETDDEELDAFLFSLGCYSGEAITVVRRMKGGCIVAIKDGRYNIDNQLAEAILV